MKRCWVGVELSIGRIETALEEYVWRPLTSCIVMVPREKAGLLYGLRYSQTWDWLIEALTLDQHPTPCWGGTGPE